MKMKENIVHISVYDVTSRIKMLKVTDEEVIGTYKLNGQINT